jgi:hypothetical protein
MKGRKVSLPFPLIPDKVRSFRVEFDSYFVEVRHDGNFIIYNG